MLKLRASWAFFGAFQGLRIPACPGFSTALSPNASLLSRVRTASASRSNSRPSQNVRLFSATAGARIKSGTWLEPNFKHRKPTHKGRPRVSTGGSVRSSAVAWGDFGLRMRDHHRRISAKQLQLAETTIKNRLRGEKFRLYKRVTCMTGVYVKGNELRMGKGKGSFDHWAARVAVNAVIFEIRGALHEQVIRDTLSLAGRKLPGQYEIVKKGDPPMCGITKLANGLTVEMLKQPWKFREACTAKVSPAVPAATPSSGSPPP